MKLPIVIALMAIALSACGPNKIKIAVPFDENQAKAMLAPGENQVNGSALIRQSGGGIVTCAGNIVILMPVTAYARQWAKHVYGTEQDGYRPTAGLGLEFEGANTFFKNVKSTNCDVEGRFSFLNIADGEFYVFTKINWTVQDQFGPVIQGGSIMKKIALSGGEKVETVLSP